MNTLIVLAHPNIDKQSTANQTIMAQLTQLQNCHIRDLYALYPDFSIDVEAEQQALLAADTVVLQFPFYWYNVPGLLKEWLDRVLTYGFAYGNNSFKLKGKRMLVSTTVGGNAETYIAGGRHRYTMAEYLRPLEQTAEFTGMTFLPPVISHDMNVIAGYNHASDVEGRALEHGERLSNQLQVLPPT